jgi:hypothetical protein
MKKKNTTEFGPRSLKSFSSSQFSAAFFLSLSTVDLVSEQHIESFRSSTERVTTEYLGIESLISSLHHDAASHTPLAIKKKMSRNNTLQLRHTKPFNFATTPDLQRRATFGHAGEEGARVVSKCRTVW